MKNIFFVLLTVLFALVSCNKEPGTDVGADEKEVDIEIKAPAVSTRAPGSESRIDRLDVLVFQGTGENAKFLYRRYAWPRTGTSTGYRTTLKLGEDLTLFFAANAQQLLDKVPSHLFDEKNGGLWKDVMEALVIESPQDISAAAGLPMWGQLSGRKIEDKTVNNLGKVKLLRAVAGADFILDPGVSNFDLEAVYIVYGADRGYLPYHDSQVIMSADGDIQKVTGPHAPVGMETNDDWEYVFKTNEKSVTEHFYMFDNDAELPGKDGKSQSKLIMKGRWTGESTPGRPTYYPIAFREKDEDSGDMVRMQVSRNYKYQITVTGVNGDGFPTLEDAKDGEEINLDYEIVDWDLQEDLEFIIDGMNWVSLERKLANIFRVKGRWDQIGMSTSYSREDIRLSTAKDVVGQKGVYSIMLNDEETGVEFCQVLMTEANNRFTFHFYTTEPIENEPDKGFYRQASVFVTVGRIAFEMKVRQHNMLLNDWENGGEIVWPFP